MTMTDDQHTKIVCDMSTVIATDMVERVFTTIADTIEDYGVDDFDLTQRERVELIEDVAFETVRLMMGANLTPPQPIR